jgi:hypothetical protein
MGTEEGGHLARPFCIPPMLLLASPTSLKEHISRAPWKASLKKDISFRRSSSKIVSFPRVLVLNRGASGPL